MIAAEDPFRHTPELRGLIEDPETSNWRRFTPESIAVVMRENGIDPELHLYPAADREASHRRFVASLLPGDLWVFAYGSLMWNPAIRFREVRRAHAPAHARRMAIKDVLGGRGTRAAPGMIAALDAGGGCDGLAFRIAESEIEAETRVIWNRERILPAYHAEMIAVDTPQGGVTALAFVLDDAAELIDRSLSRDEIARCIATGTGFLGSSLAYAENLVAHLEVIGVHDADLAELLARARTFAA